MVNRPFSMSLAFESTSGQWARSMENWTSAFREIHQHPVNNIVPDTDTVQGQRKTFFFFFFFFFFFWDLDERRLLSIHNAEELMDSLVQTRKQKRLLNVVLTEDNCHLHQKPQAAPTEKRLLSARLFNKCPSERAFARASNLMKICVSIDHLHPTSRPRTTSLARRGERWSEPLHPPQPRLAGPDHWHGEHSRGSRRLLTESFQRGAVCPPPPPTCDRQLMRIQPNPNREPSY